MATLDPVDQFMGAFLMIRRTLFDHFASAGGL